MLAAALYFVLSWPTLASLPTLDSLMSKPFMSYELARDHAYITSGFVKPLPTGGLTASGCFSPHLGHIVYPGVLFPYAECKVQSVKLPRMFSPRNDAPWNLTP